MDTVTPAVKAIIESLIPNTTYIRASSLNEANYQLPRTALTDPVGIHSNLPTVINTPGPATVSRLWPVEIMFLKKNTQFDDTTEQTDTIRDEMLVLADQFFDKMKQDAILDPTTPVQDLIYTLQAIETFQITDEILTGWMLSMEIPITRTTYEACV